MTHLFRATVNDSGFHTDGLGWFTQKGDPQTVASTPMVRLSSGVLFPAEGWHSQRSGAIREAADKIESLGHKLLAQAERLRAEAAKAVDQ